MVFVGRVFIVYILLLSMLWDLGSAGVLSTSENYVGTLSNGGWRFTQRLVGPG